MGRGRTQSGSRGRGSRTDFWFIRSVLVFRSSPWLRAVGSHLGMDREESEFGESCILRWVVSDAVLEERIVLYSLIAMWS